MLELPMSHRNRRTSIVGLLTALAILGGTHVFQAVAQEEKVPGEKKQQVNKRKQAAKMKTVQGEFEVKITPIKTDDPKLGMMNLDKAYHGELAASGTGTMLTGMTDVPTSAAYVAIERVTGTLDGKKGSFIIHHRGIMEGSKKQLEIGITPDSGTDELTGIRGTMGIDIRDGKHFYKLQYRLEPKRN